MYYFILCSIILFLHGVKSDTEDANKIISYATNTAQSIPVRQSGLSNGLHVLNSLRPSNMINAFRPMVSNQNVRVQGVPGPVSRPNKGPISNLLSQGYNYLNSLFNSWRPFSSRPYGRPGRPQTVAYGNQAPQPSTQLQYQQYPPNNARVQNLNHIGPQGIRANGQIAGQYTNKQTNHHHASQHSLPTPLQNYQS